MRFGRYHSDPFTDLLFNALLAFTFLFMATVVMVNPIAKMGKVNLKAEFIISVTWPERRSDDIDLWVQEPGGAVVSYLVKDAAWLHLDRDDRGDLNDTIVVNGKKIVHPLNQEIVTIRGLVAGEYVVNLYYYQAQILASGAPAGTLTATVKVEKVNPNLELVYVRKIELQKQDEEHTALRFRLSGEGEISAINQLPKRLTPYNLDVRKGLLEPVRVSVL